MFTPCMPTGMPSFVGVAWRDGTISPRGEATCIFATSQTAPATSQVAPPLGNMRGHNDLVRKDTQLLTSHDNPEQHLQPESMVAWLLQKSKSTLSSPVSPAGAGVAQHRQVIS
jgi:hypothetical protein